MQPASRARRDAPGSPAPTFFPQSPSLSKAHSQIRADSDRPPRCTPATLLALLPRATPAFLRLNEAEQNFLSMPGQRRLRLKQPQAASHHSESGNLQAGKTRISPKKSFHAAAHRSRKQVLP